MELRRVAKPGARLVLTDPHPQSTIVFSQALFRTETGESGFVRNHARRIGTYLKAFELAGLRILDCHEPVLKEEFSAGLGGMPFAIVWKLERAPT